MPDDIAAPGMLPATEARRAVRKAERVAAVFVTGVVIVLAIAGYRIRIRSDSNEEDAGGASSEHPGIYSGKISSSGSDTKKISVDARGALPAVFRIHRRIQGC